MSVLVPMAFTIGVCLIVVGLIAAVAGQFTGADHLGHLLALIGMLATLAGVLAEGARHPHRSTR
jgi:hypothetical protein